MRRSIFQIMMTGCFALLMASFAWSQTNQQGWPSKQNEPPTRFGPLKPAVKKQTHQTDSDSTEQYSIQLKSQNIVGDKYVSTHSTSSDVSQTGGKQDPLNQKLDSKPGDQPNPLGSMSTIRSTKPFLKVVGGLSLVLAIFYALTVFAKRNGGNISGKVPDEVIQVLGQVPLDQRRRLQLVRLGSKILLLSVTTSSVETVGEIDDPVEVEHVISIMQRGRAVEDFQNFRRITNQIRQQRRAQRMYPSQINGEIDDEINPRRSSSNVFEA